MSAASSFQPREWLASNESLLTSAAVLAQRCVPRVVVRGQR